MKINKIDYKTDLSCNKKYIFFYIKITLDAES